MTRDAARIIRQANPRRGCVRAWLAVLLTAVCASSVSADESTERYFEQLRQRGLFSLAEGYALSRLADADMSPPLRGELVLELSRTFAAHAGYAPESEREELWQQAAAVVDDLLKQDPTNPRMEMLQAQQALIPAARGELFRWQAELQPYDRRTKELGLASLDEAVERLTTVEAQLSERLKKDSYRAADGALQPHELRALLQHVRYRFGLAERDRAELLPTESPDRMAALLAAEEWFRQLASGASFDMVTWNSRLQLVQCARLRSDFGPAAQMLAQIEQSPPPEIADALTAERVRLLLADGRPTDAAQAVLDYGRRHGALPGELKFLKLKTLMALREIALGKQDATLAAELQQQGDQLVRRADAEVGGYWANRCRALWNASIDAQRLGPELAGAKAQARAAYLNGDVEQALSRYEAAVGIAERLGNDAETADLNYTRASILLDAGKAAEAAAAFTELVRRFPDSPRAAAAHLLAAYCLGRQYDQQRTKSRRLAYTEALAEHLRVYPDDPTAVDARMMLARLEEQRLQFTKALKLYQSVPANHLQGQTAQAAVARCYESILERLREIGQPAGEWEDQATTVLGNTFATFPDAPENWSAQQAEVVQRLARILLTKSRPEFAVADSLLAQLFSAWERLQQGAHPELVESWRPIMLTARQLRVVSLAGQQRAHEAGEMLESVSKASPQDMLKILNGLSQLGGRGSRDAQQRLGELQLQAAESLDQRRTDLGADDRRVLDDCLAQAYAATGQPSRAVAVYERMLERSPDDRALIGRASEQLLACGSQRCLERAKSLWRHAESLERQGSREWLAARYQVISLCQALKQHDECRKLLAVTRLLYPDLGGAEMSRKFAEIERRLPATK